MYRRYSSPSGSYIQLRSTSSPQARLVHFLIFFPPMHYAFMIYRLSCRCCQYAIVIFNGSKQHIVASLHFVQFLYVYFLITRNRIEKSQSTCKNCTKCKEGFKLCKTLNVCLDLGLTLFSPQYGPLPISVNQSAPLLRQLLDGESIE